MSECRYNPGVLCDYRGLYYSEDECESCAWNPDAAEKKRRYIDRRLCDACAKGLQIITPGQNPELGKCPNCNKWALLSTHKTRLDKRRSRNAEGG